MTLQQVHTPAEFTIEPGETCLTALMDTAKKRPHGVMFTRPANYEWVNVTGKEFIDEVFEVAQGLIALGVKQGDRIALISATRYEWSLLDYAIWAAGAASVPVYPSSSASQVRWIIEDSGAVLAITETREHSELVENLVLQDDGEPNLKGSPSRLRRVLEINSSAIDTLKFEGRSVGTDEVSARIAATNTDDLASLVYTSGTTGRPKGCILTHRNWLSEARALTTNPIGVFAVPGSHTLTFLPLAHVFSRAVSIAVAIRGASQNHWSDFSTISIEFARSRPNVILGVPRVFEKVRNSAASKAADSGIKSFLFEQSEKIAIEYSKALDTQEGPDRLLKIKHKLFDKLVYSTIRQGVGGNVRYCITGGSAMGHDLLHWFRGIGVPVYEGYGLTETAAAAAVDYLDQSIGTVGPPLGGVTMRINDDGEVCIKGGMVFQGYWNNPEATEEAFEDGWYNTGDLGEIDDDGKLTITGRKKDLIVTAGGKNVSPGPMEDILRGHPLISQAMVVGDGKPFVGALITLDPDILKRWKLDHNIPENRSMSDIATDATLRAEVQDAVNKVNSTVSHAEGIKKFYILESDLTEDENELTPTMKVKRNVVAQRYASAIEHIYKR
ncbi:AMP-dependent synthetase/ligase [Corynebacterium rhinophilum]|uniref:AMP-dependent synthetase/ligase n=1 Tax=Corynebacterium TaxID=1716 RepID=UPI00254CE8D2|nr:MULTISPECIES: long-chain fatty acid--CoA ligase [unclassified Corynebacterium]MDK8452347.1 long-chain fatty acid--CoA ligase [Corynebacterium sp. MSK084]MDK8466852.1 long-chain fatty acid--CoA ligase [Corynebacterium sp. MSK130]MDK8514406.1 long-chain fatty acid--CoA ligase [Corynebacterium sp. MSK123]MDK8547484.1 long-chain fatty acid--CoA ligase [Corynebacterium sp. MSK222]MDK8646543.1 long-chain fatty acid--CoA ligase [Corynebacterium sp. MSK082]